MLPQKKTTKQAPHTANPPRHAPYRGRCLEQVATPTGTRTLVSLVESGKTVAKVEYEDREVTIEYKSDDARERLEEHVRALPGTFFQYHIQATDEAVATFILEVIDQTHEIYWLKANCRKGTVIRLKGDWFNEWVFLRAPYDEALAERVRHEYKDLECIANELDLDTDAGVVILQKGRYWGREKVIQEERAYATDMAQHCEEVAS